MSLTLPFTDIEVVFVVEDLKNAMITCEVESKPDLYTTPITCACNGINGVNKLACES